ncbi:MucR family transcriptional regulator [Saccharothrix sp. HUAS TT1]|uniref:MucR family transcriptional regulator n=1 Tax=unclassified Saccharothrix TaxID=2593673 RepID=UPI00345C0306
MRYGDPDGFGRHGILDLDAFGNPVCHECGQPYPFLGRHVRRHGIDPDRYRERHGLGRQTPLASRQIRAEMSKVGKTKVDAPWWPKFRASLDTEGSLRAARAAHAQGTRPETRRRKQDNAVQAMRDANLARRNPTVHTCLICGAQWCRIGKGRPPKVCSDACRVRQLGWDPRAARTILLRPERVDWKAPIPEIRAQWVEPPEIARVLGLSRAYVYRVLRQERVDPGRR